MKTCFKCGQTKPLDAFYKHSKMADGHLNKCKECSKKDVQRNYRSNKPQYQRYYRDREQTQERKASRSMYRERRDAKNPERRRARTAVGNAIRDGRLARQPCEVCGAVKVEAHHADYSKPLEVRWLCFKHHREVGHGQHVTTPHQNN